jgi:hypothetical protein
MDLPLGVLDDPLGLGARLGPQFAAQTFRIGAARANDRFSLNTRLPNDRFRLLIEPLELEARLLRIGE